MNATLKLLRETVTRLCGTFLCDFFLYLPRFYMTTHNISFTKYKIPILILFFVPYMFSPQQLIERHQKSHFQALYIITNSLQ